MGISDKDIKLLWGRAANRCAICKCGLSNERPDSNGVKLFGQQAHIVAKSPDGPRGASTLTQIERDSYQNLILLCPTHHTLIDSEVGRFPVANLHAIKQEHEAWVQETLTSNVSGSELGYISGNRTFLHYLDHYFFEMKGAGPQQHEFAEARLATRLAILKSDEILIPAAAYAESAVCRSIVDEYRPIFSYGCIWQVGSGVSFAEYLAGALEQYPPGSSHRAAYLGLDIGAAPPFLTRKSSATAFIATRWRQLLETDTPKQFFLKGRLTVDRIEKRWESVPDLLGGTAFIVDHVSPLLSGQDATISQVNFLHSVINASYYEGFTEEFEAGIVEDLVYLKTPFEVRHQGSSFSYRRLRKVLQRRGLLADILNASPLELLMMKHQQPWLESLTAYFAETPLRPNRRM